MQRTYARPCFVVLAALAVVSCGGAEEDASRGEPAEVGTIESGSEASRAAPQGADGFEVKIEGSPFEGTHRLGGDLHCMAMNGTWQAGDDGMSDDGISGLIVQMEGVPSAGGSTDQVNLSVMFGQIEGSSGPSGLIDVRGSGSGGDGRGTVTREGRGAVLGVEGTTHNGAKVRAVLRCANVFEVG